MMPEQPQAQRMEQTMPEDAADGTTSKPDRI
jgi:hypothetical protein